MFQDILSQLDHVTKRGKERFNDGVRASLSAEVLTLQRTRKFAWQAHQFIPAYHALDSGQAGTETVQDCLKYIPIAVTKLLQRHILDTSLCNGLRFQVHHE